MKLLWPVTAIALALYTAGLIVLEWHSSQAHVRPYFTDIEGPVFWYAINTSLSSALLWGTALLLFYAAFAGGRRWDQRAGLFAIQGVFCLYMALDDRFEFHEHIAPWLGIHDPYLMAGIALANTGLFFLLFRPRYFNWTMAVALLGAAAFYFSMMFWDGLMPEAMRLRLSLEDLSKTWAGFMFLTFAWEAARFTTVGVARGESNIRIPPVFVKHVPAWLTRFIPAAWLEDLGLESSRWSHGLNMPGDESPP